MSRGSCERCHKPDAILRIVTVASKFRKRMCIPCVNNVIEYCNSEFVMLVVK